MRRILLFILIIPFSIGFINAQTPDLFNYQAVVRNDQGNVIANQNVGIKISILKGSANGTVVYEEEHSVTSTDQGEVALMIGNGSVISGSVSDIEWGSDNYYLKVGLDETGGTSYKEMGTTQLVAVPYAQYADSSGSAFSGSYNDLTDTPALGKYVDTSMVTLWDKDSTDDFSGNYADLNNKPVDTNGVATDNILDEAVTEAKIEDLSITKEKINYLAVDSSRLDPLAVKKWLRPVLQYDQSRVYVGVNREESITGSSAFGVTSDVSFDDNFGGMYINTDGAESWPFYGYASDNEEHAWHYYDHSEKNWVLEFNSVSPRHRLMVNQNGVMPGGDGDIKLGTSSHRWSEVHAKNGTILTSDGRLKTNLTSLGYGLQEVLQLNPVLFNWKENSAADGSEEEKHIGLVAQEVRKIMSELVKQPESEQGYLGMDYSELIPVLVKAIQEQQEIIKTQEKKIQEQDKKLENELSKLKKKVDQINREVNEKN